MNVKHLRAKYQIEQYPVVFTFPEQVLGEPSVRVEVLSGVDPLPEGFAGFPLVNGNLVAVLVSGGVPGVIYSISCTAAISDDVLTLSGIIAVIQTAAEPPPNTGGIPLADVVTTPPYAIYNLDGFDSNSIILSGNLYRFPIDGFDSSASFVSGTLRDLVITYNGAPEGFDSAATFLSGTLRNIVITYTMLPEGFDSSSTFISGTLKDVVVTYLNYAPEGFDSEATFVSGTLV